MVNLFLLWDKFGLLILYHNKLISVGIQAKTQNRYPLPVNVLPKFCYMLVVHFLLFSKKYKGSPAVYYVVMTIIVWI